MLSIEYIKIPKRIASPFIVESAINQPHGGFIAQIVINPELTVVRMIIGSSVCNLLKEGHNLLTIAVNKPSVYIDVLKTKSFVSSNVSKEIQLVFSIIDLNILIISGINSLTVSCCNRSSQ